MFCPLFHWADKKFLHIIIQYIDEQDFWCS